MHVVTETRPGQRRDLRAQRLQPRVRRPRRVRRLQRSDPHASPATAPSSSAATARWPTPRPCAACGSPAASARDSTLAPPCRSRSTLDDGQERTSSSSSAPPGVKKQARQLVQRFRGVDSAHRALEGVWDYWSRTLGAVYCRNARPGRQLPGQRLAHLSDARLPHVGPHRVLSVGRRVRLPRPIAGRDGPGACRAAVAARASAPRRRAPVPRRGRAALVASAGGPRRAHALLRRLPLAPLRHLPLRRARPATPACSTSACPS